VGYRGAIPPTGGVGTAQIADGSILAIDLCDGAVTTCKLADGAVTVCKIGNGAVGSAQIASLAICGAHIQGATIQGSHIANLAILGGHIASNAITSGHIASVSGAAIASGSVTPAKLCLSCDYTWTGVHSFAGGKLVLPTAGGTTCGELRFCTCTSAVQVYYSAAWHNFGDYVLGTEFYLPMVGGSGSRDGRMCWNSACYRPAFECSSTWYNLATAAEFSYASGCISNLSCTMSTVCSCVSWLSSCVSGLGSCLSSACSCISNHESRIYALEHS
jgi:hypothetical protein